MQSTTPHPNLNLAKSIRPGLDILANEIVIALKKRSRFLTNSPVYEPGLIPTHPEQSLLDYELTAVERQHAELGRYAFAEQDAFSDVSDVPLVLVREAPDNPVPIMPSRAGDRIKAFYLSWIQLACEHGTNENTFGETATSDVAVLLNIMERVNLGKLVAESKYQEMPDAFQATGGDRAQMLQYIVRKDREATVREIAVNLANQYGLPSEHVVSVFDFMIETTVDIEVDYLQQRLNRHNS